MWAGEPPNCPDGLPQERAGTQAPLSKPRPDGTPRDFPGMRLHHGEPIGAAVARVSCVARRGDV